MIFCGFLVDNYRNYKEYNIVIGGPSNSGKTTLFKLLKSIMMNEDNAHIWTDQTLLFDKKQVILDKEKRIVHMIDMPGADVDYSKHQYENWFKISYMIDKIDKRMIHCFFLIISDDDTVENRQNIMASGVTIIESLKHFNKKSNRHLSICNIINTKNDSKKKLKLHVIYKLLNIDKIKKLSGTTTTMCFDFLKKDKIAENLKKCTNWMKYNFDDYDEYVKNI